MVNDIFLLSLFNPSKFSNLNAFIDYTYSMFIKDFNPNSPRIEFNSKEVMARPKILNCSNCGNKCNNQFECQNCPFFNKLDIFQHICSDEDPTLPVLPEYKNKKNRTPGIYNRNRATKVAWLRFMIENYQNENFIWYYNRPSSNKELNHFFWLHKEHYILILVEEKRKIYIRSCYDIKSDEDEKKHYRHYLQYKQNIKRECT